MTAFKVTPLEDCGHYYQQRIELYGYIGKSSDTLTSSAYSTEDPQLPDKAPGFLVYEQAQS